MAHHPSLYQLSYKGLYCAPRREVLTVGRFTGFPRGSVLPRCFRGIVQASGCPAGREKRGEEAFAIFSVTDIYFFGKRKLHYNLELLLAKSPTLEKYWLLYTFRRWISNRTSMEHQHRRITPGKDSRIFLPLGNVNSTV